MITVFCPLHCKGRDFHRDQYPVLWLEKRGFDLRGYTATVERRLYVGTASGNLKLEISDFKTEAGK
jgi:hypothetical protein